MSAPALAEAGATADVAPLTETAPGEAAVLGRPLPVPSGAALTVVPGRPGRAG